ncbi:MAG: 3'-5' exonuclease, partial [Candidatus Gracilibacteria bacterium]|nr:3'-5' exonuclease [Candidatus Gracilibacteria bacterium]
MEFCLSLKSILLIFLISKKTMTDYSHYVSLDLETTGLDPSSCDITEIAMIKVRNGEIVDRMETFVYTPLEISQHISYLTGITAKDLENAPDFVQLIPKIEEFIGSDPLMGHNIWFDGNFLTEKGVKIPDSALWDTYLMSNILYPELPSHSLETNSKYFGIHHVDSHRAMADVMACYELWKILIDTFPDLTDEQKEQIRKLSQKTSWPLMSYFLQDKTAHRHVLDVPETFLYHPHELSSLDVRDRNEHLFI